MFFIHQNTCISPQKTFCNTDFTSLIESSGNKLKAAESVNEEIPPAVLRRMGKAVKMGISAAIPIIKAYPKIDGIILGTANGGMEDCIKFLNQIKDYDEGILTPGNFVQSTPNAIAAQIGLMTKNKAYNITHVHRGLAFETALTDAAMMIKENPGCNYLLGAVDEISAYNFNIDYLNGWYKKEIVSNKNLYTSQTAGSIAGEGAAMFLVNDKAEGAVAQLKAIKTLHTNDEKIVKNEFKKFVENNFSDSSCPNILLTGENGDSRLLKYYLACESLLDPDTAIARYKHLSGEYPTASSFAFWLACQLLKHQQIPLHAVKRPQKHSVIKNIVLYNNYKGIQHVFATFGNNKSN